MIVDVDANNTPVIFDVTAPAEYEEDIKVRTSPVNEERETLTESQVLEMLDDAEVSRRCSMTQR